MCILVICSCAKGETSICFELDTLSSHIFVCGFVVGGWKGQLSAWSPKSSHVGSEFRMDSSQYTYYHATTCKVKVVFCWVMDLL